MSAGALKRRSRGRLIDAKVLRGLYKVASTNLTIGKRNAREYGMSAN
jgi:hypothetical protein